MKKDLAIFLFIIFIASGLSGLGGDKLLEYFSSSRSNNAAATPSPAVITPAPTNTPSPTPSPTPTPGP